jgi:hypothetical protein
VETACATLNVVEQANTIIGEYRAQGFLLTLRQLFYQFVARGSLENLFAQFAPRSRRHIPAQVFYEFEGMGLTQIPIAPSTLELGRSQIDAELGEFVEGNEKEQPKGKEDEAAADLFGRRN